MVSKRTKKSPLWVETEASRISLPIRPVKRPHDGFFVLDRTFRNAISVNPSSLVSLLEIEPRGSLLRKAIYYFSSISF